MTEINVYDYSTLEPINEFAQYDSNRIILIPKIVTNAVEVQCHFCNTQSKSAFVTNITELTINSNEYYRAIVPNILLIQNIPIIVYLYVIIEYEGKTVYYKKISVNNRPKPDDFIYSDNSQGALKVGKPQIQIGGEEPTDDNIILWLDENDDGYTISYPDVKQVEDEIYGEALKLIVGGIE